MMAAVFVRALLVAECSGCDDGYNLPWRASAPLWPDLSWPDYSRPWWSFPCESYWEMPF